MARWKSVAVVAAAAFTLVSCGARTTAVGPAAARPAATDSRAADLRTRLDDLLGEHLMLGAKATDAALGGRSDEFAAYGDLVNKNTTDLGDLVGSALGSDAQSRLGRVMSLHDVSLVDYTMGVARKDQALQTKAVQELMGQYVPQFADFVSATTGLAKDALTDLAKLHVLQEKQIVDDQAKKDWTAAYGDVRAAFAHEQMIGDTVAAAIVKNDAGRFPGDATSRSVDLRVALNQLLEEHTYLATATTDAALGTRPEEFQAAGKAVNDNGTALGRALGSIYGSDAENQFVQIWSAHNGYLVDYTTALAKRDRAGQDRAVQELNTEYVPQFATFFAGGTNLSRDSLSGLIKPHVSATKDVVDAQSVHDVKGAAGKDRDAAQHMAMVGDPLASAIVRKLPQKFV
jgi:hypothetical protein